MLIFVIQDSFMILLPIDATLKNPFVTIMNIIQEWIADANKDISGLSINAKDAQVEHSSMDTDVPLELAQDAQNPSNSIMETNAYVYQDTTH